MISLIDAETEIGQNCDGLYQAHSQVITDELLDELKSERFARAAVRASNYARCASVPTFVVELWQRQGYDFYRMSAREIVNKLNADDLGSFVTARNV